MLKKLLIGLLGLIVLLLVVLLGGRWWMGRSQADPARGAALAGLGAPVEVWRDSLGVPHVWARDEYDLFRAMGYVHAQDRLFQMEMFRRVADGRLAQILGEPLLETDRFLRTIGMGRSAAENEARLDPAHRRALQAYADGVNAWITGHPGPLPPEFVTLRFKPEPWTVRNSLSIAKIMAWDLADWNLGLDVQRALDAVGDSLGRDLLPFYPDSGLTILGSDADWEGRGDTPPAESPTPAPLPRVSGVELPDAPALALELLESVSASHASNSWVIGGSRTRSGKPILANDMHLALRAPAIWYLAALHGGGVNVAGMTLPGVPVVVAGHSDRVAWGYTNAMVDDVDLFVEEVDPNDPNRYRTPGGWEDMTVRPETIQVKGKPAVVQTVRTTRHGPVLSDVEKRGGDRVLAMQWTAYAPSTEVVALLGMNRARNADEFLRALAGFNNPHQNVVYADADGRFGYWMAGRVPLRRGGDGVLPAPGWTGEADWAGWLGFGQHPHVQDPADGFVVTANNRQVGAAYPHHISANWAEPWRAVRIRQMVEAGRNLTAADVLAQQMDVRDVWALRHLPRAVQAAERAGLADAATELREWNGEARVDSRAAALFYVWFEAFRGSVGVRRVPRQAGLLSPHGHGPRAGARRRPVGGRREHGHGGDAGRAGGGGHAPGRGDGGAEALGRAARHPHRPSHGRRGGAGPRAGAEHRPVPQRRLAVHGERERVERAHAAVQQRVRQQPAARGGHGGPGRLRRIRHPHGAERQPLLAPLPRPDPALARGPPLADSPGPRQGRRPRRQPDDAAAGGLVLQLRVHLFSAEASSVVEVPGSCLVAPPPA